MCKLCTTAKGELLLAQAERQLVLAESDAGLSTPTAVRPLNAAERRARVRFGDIDTMERTAESDAANVLLPLRAEVNDALLDELFAEGDAVTPKQLADKLTTLLQVQPERVQRAVVAASDDIGDILRSVYAKSAEIVVEEAKRQGSDVSKLDAGRLKFADAQPSLWEALSSSVASYFWQRITTVLQRELLSPTTLVKQQIVRDDVDVIMGGIDPAGALDSASQAIHAARGAGRYDQAAEFEPEEIWASELMDGRTCRPCELVDGKEYATLAEARVEYEAGGYGACAGGARCRGTLVMIYGDPPARPAEPEPVAPAPAPEPKPKTTRRRTVKPKVEPAAPVEPAEPAAAPKRAVKTPAAPKSGPLQVPLPTSKPSPAVRPVDPDGRQRFMSLRELPVKKSNEIKSRVLDADIIKHLTPAKRTAAKAKAAAAGLFDEAKLVNPMRGKLDKGGFGYTSNCSNCVTAYEMRRRGFDVNAAKIDVKGRYPKDFVDAWWKKADGSTPSMDFVGSRRGLEGWAADYPDGARGFITCAWKTTGTGHVFSWEKVDGKIVYIEPQNPLNGDAEEHWKRIKPDSVLAVRVDDLVPTDKVVLGLETKGKR
ncbi:capsid maturation protease [Arthrobacter phage Sicarius2]|uniref:Capsid maturation protease n=1 Tax=Arthrobacter phage Sicarius2 TaxID=2836090 RepID=A0A8F3INY3_9CAUD|nr:capsid maturation protease [Arthrobacter phage Sicarius2]